MVKKRIIPTLLYKDFTLVKGVAFHSWRRIGSIMQAVKVYNMRQVDELAFFDITATADSREPDFALIDEFADECFMPLVVGGGIRSVEHMRRLLKCGADKVSINSAAITDPDIVRSGADTFGSQCIVVSIDAKRLGQNKYEVVTHSGTNPTSISPAELAKEVERLGAGEIIITSVDRDGTMTGYDVELIKCVVDAVSIPVIASGGAGNFQHMKEAFCCGASAVAAASIFHFTEMTPLEAKHSLKDSGINVRI